MVAKAEGAAPGREQVKLQGLYGRAQQKRERTGGGLEILQTSPNEFGFHPRSSIEKVERTG